MSVKRAKNLFMLCCAVAHAPIVTMHRVGEMYKISHARGLSPQHYGYTASSLNQYQTSNTRNMYCTDENAKQSIISPADVPHKTHDLKQLFENKYKLDKEYASLAFKEGSLNQQLEHARAAHATAHHIHDKHTAMTTVFGLALGAHLLYTGNPNIGALWGLSVGPAVLFLYARQHRLENFDHNISLIVGERHELEEKKKGLKTSIHEVDIALAVAISSPHDQQPK
jgi:hypothetical protein